MNPQPQQHVWHEPARARPITYTRTQGILGYAREYASRNCLVRLFTSAGDAERFQEYVEELRRLGEDLRLLLAVDSNARLHAVQASMAASLAVLSEQRVAYQVGGGGWGQLACLPTLRS